MLHHHRRLNRKTRIVRAIDERETTSKNRNVKRASSTLSNWNITTVVSQASRGYIHTLLASVSNLLRIHVVRVDDALYLFKRKSMVFLPSSTTLSSGSTKSFTQSLA